MYHVYGLKIFCEMSKVPFDISHETLNPCTCTCTPVCGEFRQGLNCTGPTEMISHLSWPSLEVWRKVAWLTLFYKMANNLVLMSTRSLLIPAHRSTRAKPPHAYMPMFHTPKRLYQYYSFLPRTVTVRLEWPSKPNSCCFITWGFQSLRDGSTLLIRSCWLVSNPLLFLFQHSLFFYSHLP